MTSETLPGVFMHEVGVCQGMCIGYLERYMVCTKDILSSLGFCRLLLAALQLAPSGLCFIGIPCSTWVVVNRALERNCQQPQKHVQSRGGTSKRSRECPLGTTLGRYPRSELCLRLGMKRPVVTRT